MRFEISERINTLRSEKEIYEALFEQFRKVSSKVENGQGRFMARMIEASFGSINRKDETEVTIKPVENGYLLIADVLYRPSIAFWVILAITLFTYVGWLVPLGFYLYHKKTVSQAIKACFERIRNEFEQAGGGRTSTIHVESVESAIERLGKLKERGLITDDEFMQRKQILLSKEDSTGHSTLPITENTPKISNTEIRPPSAKESFSDSTGATQTTLKGHDLPEEIKGWSWGGFLLNGFWAIGNRTWIGLLSFVPIIGLPVPFLLGFKGKEWAWRNKQWDSIEHFQKTQKKWTTAGVVVYAVSFPIIALDHFYPKIEQYFHPAVEDSMTMEDALNEYELEKQKTSAASTPQADIQDQEPPPPSEVEPKPEQPAWTPIFDDKSGDPEQQIFSTHAGPLRLSRNATGERFIILNGQRLFSGDDSQYQTPIRSFTLSDRREAVLIESSGGRGTSCETLMFFLLIDGNGRWNATPRFGTCARDGSFRQDGDTIELQIPEMGGMSIVHLQNGTVYKKDEPVELNAENDPAQ